MFWKYWSMNSGGYARTDALVNHFNDAWNNRDNPVWWSKMARSTPSPISGLYQWYFDYRESEDRARMDTDLYKNTGQTWKNSQYPWYSYHNQTYSGRSGAGGYGQAFGVSAAIVGSFNRRLYKW